MIGWDKLRLGFWSTQWKTVQALYIKERGLKQSEIKWATMAQLAVWKYVLGNWTYRNSQVHGETRDEQQQKR